MPNSAGVVGPDYLIPQDLDFSTADGDDLAQALVNIGVIADSEGGVTPQTTNVFGPDYLTPVEADLTSPVSAATLITALETAGIIDDDGDGLSVVGPDYLEPQDPATSDLDGLLSALETAGYLNDTSS